MFFRGSSIVIAVIVLTTDGYVNKISRDEVSFKIRTTNDNERGIFAKSKLEERRNFIHLFNVPYIICFFAAKGKWPFIPPFMQIQVDQVGRSIFPQSDSFIRNFCQKWIQIRECFRPQRFVSVNPDPFPIVTPAALKIEDDVEIFTTPCNCDQRSLEGTLSPIVFFDKKSIGNVSSDIVLNTIEFLQSFLPPTTKKPKPKRKNKIHDRI